MGLEEKKAKGGLLGESWVKKEAKDSTLTYLSSRAATAPDSSIVLAEREE